MSRRRHGGKEGDPPRVDEADWKTDEDRQLLEDIYKAAKAGEVTKRKLVADDRVLARISDGIYREPASALRELVANAYDADATRVTITTDAPRFSSITVRDNGNGMTREALVRLINHIGGSAKRQTYGSDIGVSRTDDRTLSPGGRKLIGKIGIGLFAVSQLCRDFQVITKRQGESFRLMATISLRRYSEDDPEPAEGEIEAGNVEIRTVEAKDERAHGTDIILSPLSPPARDLLRSRDIWERIIENESDEKLHGDTFTAPTFHVGRVDATGEILEKSENLPWESADSPEDRFRKLHEKVLAETGSRNAKPRLDTSLDRYLRTLWYLSLAAPLDYLDGRHPFDLTGKDFKKVYLLSNLPKGKVDEHKLAESETIRDKFKFSAPVKPTGAAARFDLFVDNVKLARPLAFDGGPAARKSDPAKAPLLFVGRFHPDLSTIPAERSGGAHLSFESYFLWTPRVVPTEHNGVMIRIADASGTLFDNTFLGYQVAEITRLSQLSSELFVLQGLDSALNIDRESFNFGHPHAKIVASWMHRALRQVATAQKRIVKEVREKRRGKGRATALAKTEQIVEDQVDALGLDEAPEVALVDGDDAEVRRLRKEGTTAFLRSAVLGAPKNLAGAAQKNRAEILQRRVVAIIQLLEGYGALRRLTYEQQQELIKAIADILGIEE
jgi:hypothetical protein